MITTFAVVATDVAPAMGVVIVAVGAAESTVKVPLVDVAVAPFASATTRVIATAALLIIGTVQAYEPGDDWPETPCIAGIAVGVPPTV